jgi:hypothetical protein
MKSNQSHHRYRAFQTIAVAFVALLLLPPLANSADPARAEKMVWQGGTDSNWNIASNWSSGQVPGSQQSDDVVIMGKDAIVSVPTPVAATNEYSVDLVAGASLFIERDMPRVARLGVGNGASKVTQFESEVAIAGNLLVAGKGAATNPGEYHLQSGVLSVGDQLDVHGRFTVDDAHSTISIKKAVLGKGSILKFDFDLDGISSIQVKDQLTIEDGARIEIDLRGNNVGNNVVKLLEFSRLSGRFQPKNVVIKGQCNGKLITSETSISVSFEDAVERPETSLWFTCGALEKTGSDRSLLKVNTGRRIRDLTSPGLSCKMKHDGKALIYHVSWTDSDVDGDGKKDALSFDLRVEGFDGSVVSGSLEGTVGGSYERKGRVRELNPQEPVATDPVTSVTLGKTATLPSFSDGNWGVGKDKDIDAGESLRFSVENIRLASGSELNFEGFVSFQLAEPRGGNSHVLVVGQGKNVDVATANSPTHVAIPPTRTLLLTSARNSKVAAGSVVVKFVSRTQPETLGKDVEDYSTLPNGPYFRKPYPPQADQSNFPTWSWDRVQRWGSVTSGNSDPAFIQAMASHHQILSVGNTFGDGGFETAAALKKANPELKILFYVNTGIFFGNYTGGLPVNEEWFKYTLNDDEEREEDTIRKYQSFNHSYPELRDWWAKRAADAAKHPAIDGIFIDKASDESAELVDEDGNLTDGTGHVRSYVGLFRAAPKNALIIGNTLRNERDGGSREVMNIFSGSYIERWERPSRFDPSLQTVADARVASIQLMREAALKGKILMPAFHDRIERNQLKTMIKGGKEDELKQLIRGHVTKELAYYLIVAEKYSYFRYQPEKASNMPLYVNDPTELVDELTRPIGPPLGPPKKNGYEYTRLFEHVDVWLNVESGEARLNWH